MNGHPSVEVRRKYRERSLTPLEFLDVDQHVATCSDCRANLGEGMSSHEIAARWAEALAPCEHLPFELMQRHVDGETTADEAAEIDAHERTCRMCAGELRDLQTFAAARRPVVARSRRFWLAPAAAVVVVAAIAGIVNRTPERVAVPVTAPVPPSAPAPRPAPRPLAADPVAQLPPELARIAHALERGNLGGIQLAASLMAGPEQQRANSRPAAATVQLQSPVGVAIETDRPSFRWIAPDDAKTVVQVFLADQSLVAESGRLESRSWRLREPLVRGQAYVWQLAVQRAGDEPLTYPAPPDPPARFHVISAEGASDLARARRAGSDLEIGLLCMREGLVGEGVERLERYAAAHPDSAGAARLAQAARRELRRD